MRYPQGNVKVGLRSVMIALVASCAPHPLTQPPPGSQLIYTPADSAARVVDWGGSYGFASPHRELIRDSTRWREVWALFNDPSPAPPIDFAQYALVLVALGTFSGSGPSIRIDSVLVADRELFVVVTSALCNGPWGGGAMVTAPKQVIRVPATACRARFIERRTSFFGCLDQE